MSCLSLEETLGFSQSLGKKKKKNVQTGLWPVGLQRWTNSAVVASTARSKEQGDDVTGDATWELVSWSCCLSLRLLPSSWSQAVMMSVVLNHSLVCVTLRIQSDLPVHRPIYQFVYPPVVQCDLSMVMPGIWFGWFRKGRIVSFRYEV